MAPTIALGRKTIKIKHKPIQYQPQQHSLEIGAEPQEKQGKRKNETTTENMEADNEDKSRKKQMPTTLVFKMKTTTSDAL
ncbi:hypothetical protein CHS0354_028563 [Potamilus streckersoni]|uniref:Uncharacterized protein n=1 Tax=Potamilus streckersoni TaxID=2493646 RepID=A0AAE0SN50_9BIVA|nr:hypothetical protein CHS0354_028563 [Potamilus streckersoni]